ncbi:MAG: M23 family metallopeptidase, partial [Novosphingobium sp.]
MRSQGQVRFIHVSSRVQMAAAGAATALLAVWLGTMGAAAVAKIYASHEQAVLLGREAAVAKSESRVQAYRNNISATTADLARRQKFIEQMVEAHIGDLPNDRQAGETVSDSTGEAAKTVRKISEVLPEARGLAEVEAEQLAFVERLTRYADRRSASASAAIRKLGLNPNAIIASSNGAEGGPLMRLATSADGSLDPRFQRMGMSLARMDALENGLASIPQVSPAHVAYVSSSYGYRTDPFTGAAAFHAGLDFPGPRGSPIYAAGDGVVEKAQWVSGYGRYVMLKHVNGYETGYGHMSRFADGIAPGVRVRQGQIIGYVGSTGVSTGNHLHFEIKINGRFVDPVSVKLPRDKSLPANDQRETQRRQAKLDRDRQALGKEFVDGEVTKVETRSKIQHRYAFQIEHILLPKRFIQMIDPVEILHHLTPFFVMAYSYCLGWKLSSVVGGGLL